MNVHITFWSSKLEVLQKSLILTVWGRNCWTLDVPKQWWSHLAENFFGYIHTKRRSKTFLLSLLFDLVMVLRQLDLKR